MKNDIRRLKKIIAPILKKHGVKKAGIFGSYARGDEKKGSDIDIAIEFPSGKSLFDLVRLKLELEEATGKKIDINTYRAIHPLIKEDVLKEEVPVL